jgi:hypothetical protein
LDTRADWTRIASFPFDGAHLNPALFFSDDYSSARQQFRDLAAKLGWHLESFALEERGPSGEALAIDVAIGDALDSEGKQRCLVVSSGLHGVEAFLGSALQCAAMRSWIDRPDTAPAQRKVFLHALNPYGFAWLRRADQVNIDLNRNFLLDDEAYRSSPARYPDLDGVLNPKCAPRQWDTFTLQALARIAHIGLPALKAAIAGGQFEFPEGLFYGGAGASHTKQIMENNLPRWLGDSNRVMHLDLHSGLGKWASYKLLVDYALNEHQRGRLRDWFGAEALEESAAGTSDERVGYATRGGFGQWCVSTHANEGRDYLFAYAEFGAYNIVRTLAGLRAENQAHFWDQVDTAASLRAKQRLKELLCPASKVWREQVIAKGVALINQAASGLARTSE